jgi:SsrA-binding protein
VSAKGKSDQAKEERKVLSQNKRARHLYRFDELLETGIALAGSEVKSVREGHANLVDAFAEVKNGELWLLGADISPYVFAHARNHEPRRARRLLAHKQEILRLGAKVQEKGYTLIPTQMYLVRGRVKVELALAKGKQEYDKRHDQRKRDAQRDIEAALSRRR